MICFGLLLHLEYAAERRSGHWYPGPIQLSGNNRHRTEGDQRQHRNLGKEKCRHPLSSNIAKLPLVTPMYVLGLSENQEDDIVLKKRTSRPHREEETSMVWPNISDDKRGLAKYL